MCITPCNLPKIGPVACRYCWQCKENRINDYVGRCLAEQAHSSHTFAVTLTYRGDVVNAATLVYSDFQNAIKKLRKDYDVRYIVAGEYGSKKGRAHWHAVLFFKDAAPSVVTDVKARKPGEVILPRWKGDPDARIEWKYWEHGFCYFQRPDYGGFAYCLKYALKDQTQNAVTGHLAMSKKPPLGAGFFDELADQYVSQGLAPQTFMYTVGDQYDKKGKRRQFFLQGKSRENFLRRYIDQWERVYGTPAPLSEMVQAQEDKDFDRFIGMDEDDFKADREYSEALEIKRLHDKSVRYFTPQDEFTSERLFGQSEGPRDIRGVIWGLSPRPVLFTQHRDGTLTVTERGGRKWLVEDKAETSRLVRDSPTLEDLYYREYDAPPDW